MSQGGVRRGAAFNFGWLLSLAIVVAVTVLATGNKPPAPNTAPSLAALAVKILIGVALLFIAVRQRRKMGKPKKPKKQPKWQTGLEDTSPWLLIGIAPLTQPWGLVATGVATIMGAKLSSWQSYIALFLFCIVSTLIYLVMEIYAGFRPERAQVILHGVKDWIELHTDQVIIIASLLLGFWLVGKSLYVIVT
jgi:hypothetical protein